MKLLIVESPTKAKTIENYLKDYKVVSSYGAIRDLATSGFGGFGVDIEDNFKPRYIVIPEKKEVVDKLKKLSEQAEEVIIATDPDREGEAIAWHIAEELGLDKDKNLRVRFQEITKRAITREMKNTDKINEDLVKSQESRRIVDRIIGFSLSKIVQSKLDARSAGRVQSVALKLIVDLEKEIDAFIPEKYYDIKLYKPKKAKKVFNIEKDTFLYSGDYQNLKSIDIKEKEAENILKEAQNPFKVTDIKVRIVETKSKRPYITSTIQQDAFNRLGYTTAKTMFVLQSLFEGIEINKELTGLITYIRTDSTRLAPDFIKEAKDYVVSNFGNDYLGDYFYKSDDKAQDAHEAIRPTDLSLNPDSIKESLSKEEYNVYKMIYERAIQAFMKPAQTEVTDVILSSNGHDFKVTGRKNIFKGCLIFDTIKDTEIPNFNIGDIVDDLVVTKELKYTKPKARYTEASLIKELEENGIGRPSTYSVIVSSLKNRDYVNVEKRKFIPTELGKLVSNRLDEYFDKVINISYTSNLEKVLDDIANGETEREEFLQDFYGKFKDLVVFARENMEKEAPMEVGKDCPECGSPLIYKTSKYGRFIGCSGFPECKHIEKIVKTRARKGKK